MAILNILAGVFLIWFFLAVVLPYAIMFVVFVLGLIAALLGATLMGIAWIVRKVRG